MRTGAPEGAARGSVSLPRFIREIPRSHLLFYAVLGLLVTPAGAIEAEVAAVVAIGHALASRSGPLHDIGEALGQV